MSDNDRRSEHALEKREAHKQEKRKNKRRLNHIAWESICAMCGVEFTHDRMSAVYCSQKCRNKSRSYSPRFLDSLIKRSMLTLKSFKRESLTPEERAFNKQNETQKDLIANLLESGLVQTEYDAKEFIKEQELKKRQRDLKIEAENLNPDYTNIKDPEMVNFKLPDKVPKEITENNDNDDNLPTLDIGE